MENKNELTEKLKVLELEVHNAKTDLKAINSKLDTAYEYEAALVQRQTFAKNETEQLRQQFFKKSSDIQEIYKKMKYILDVFTGNFFE